MVPTWKFEGLSRLKAKIQPSRLIERQVKCHDNLAGELPELASPEERLRRIFHTAARVGNARKSRDVSLVLSGFSCPLVLVLRTAC
jgi:hypothetical protein